MSAIWKQRLDKNLLILFQPPERAKSSPTPSATIRLSAVSTESDVSTDLSLLRSASRGTVCEDLLSLHLTTAPTSPSVVGEPGGRAFLYYAGESAWHPVVVARIEGRTVYLQHPVDVDLDGKSVELHWNIWTATETDATLKGTARRSIPVEVSYTENTGTGGATLEYVADRLLHVERRPFTTGLQDSHVYRLVQGLEVMRPGTQEGYKPQREAATEELVAMLRAEGLEEDKATGSELLMVHAYLTASIVLRGQGAIGEDGRDASSSYLSRAEHLFKKRLKSLDWYDADGDGAVDDGEAGRQVTGARGGVAYRGGKAASSRTYSVGMKH